jgi:hypothetical protein
MSGVTSSIRTGAVLMSAQSKWNVREKDRETFKLFHERAVELSKLGTYPVPFGASIAVREDKLDVSAVVPNEDVLRSAAMAARLFVQQKESTHLPRICNLLHLAATEDQQRTTIADIRRSFLENMRRDCHVQVGGLRTNEQVLDTVLNGAYFHSDPKLREVAKKLEEGPGVLAKQAFAILLVDVRSTVEAVQALVEEALEITPVVVPGLKQILTLLAARGHHGAAVEILDCEADMFGEEAAPGIVVQVDSGLSAKAADEIHFESVIVLRDAYPFRKWYALQWRGESDRWLPPRAVSPYPRFP